MSLPSTILNFRDVAKTVNDFTGQRRLREGLFYRSARPDDASLEDRKLLKDTLAIKSVIDLRTKTEHANQAKKRTADLLVPALVQSNAALAEPVQIPGLKYHEIRITGGGFEKFLMGELSWGNYLLLITRFIFGWRNEAISILAREVMVPRGLTGLGLDTLDHSVTEVAATLRAFLEPSGLPIIVHCTQGKDRTGLVVALILMILDVPLDAIIHDYNLSDGALVSEEGQRLVEMREIGLPDDWIKVSKDLIPRMQEHLEQTYGGLHQYLDKIGFGKVDRHRLRQFLLY